MRGVVWGALLGLLTLSGTRVAFSAPLTSENSAWNINRAEGEQDPSQYRGEWPGHAYFPSPADWRELGVYQIITDRFSDGVPHNNEGRYGGYAIGDIKGRHGGDFQGIADHLDYIKGLGFDAIWISPIFQNLAGNPSGYAQTDFTLIDDRMGTLAELRALVEAAHSRKMYVIVDIVVNHLSYLYYPEGFRGKRAPFRMHHGEYRLLPRTEGVTYEDFQVNNTFSPQGKYCDVYGQDGIAHQDSSGEGSFWESDLHHNGDLTDYDDPWINALGTIYGSLNDLRLCAPRVQQKIVAMTKALIASADIDGIRIDTPMQVPLEFFKVWTPEVKSYARSLGKENFFMVGETYSRKPKTATMIGRGKIPKMAGKEQFIDDRISMDAGIDYWFYHSMISSLFFGDSVRGIDSMKKLYNDQPRLYDLFDPVAGELRRRMLIFFNSHDQRRLVTAAHGLEKSRLAAALIALWPGIPLYYYGDEQDFSSYGTALDGHAREDMMTGIAYRNHPSVIRPNPSSRDNFDMTHPSYLYTARLMDLRRKLWPLLKEEGVDFLWERRVDRGVILAWARVGSDSPDRIVVLMNSSPANVILRRSEKRLSSGWSKQVTLHNFVQPGEHLATDETGGFDSLEFSPYEVKILLPSSMMPHETPRVIRATPSHDAVVPAGKTRFEVEFSVPVSPESLHHAVVVNGKAITGGIEVSHDGTKLSFDYTVTEGITTWRVVPVTVSSKGEPLRVPFSSRVRAGGEGNIIVNDGATLDESLINVGETQTTSPEVMLHHKALGAKFFRVKNENSPFWGPWTGYTSTSKWSVGGSGGGWKNITVEYWAEGSGAYFVQDGIDYYVPDGVVDKM